MARYTMRQLMAMAERRLAKAIGRTEREITQIYAAVREDIRAELAKVYEKHAVDGKLTRAQMAKYGRLEKLEKELTKKLNDADRKVINKNHTLARDQYKEGYYNRAWVLDNELESRLGWGLLNDKAVRAAVENPFHKIADSRLLKDGRTRIRSAIASGLTRGDSFAQMSKEIGEAINGNRYAAMRIARTEAGRAQTIGTQRTHERAEQLGVVGNEYWSATLDERTRIKHGQLDGVPKNREQNGWKIPGRNQYTPGPKQSGIAAFDINCRCGVEYRVDDEAPSVRRIRGKGVVPYQNYSEWRQAIT